MNREAAGMRLLGPRQGRQSYRNCLEVEDLAERYPKAGRAAPQRWGKGLRDRSGRPRRSPLWTRSETEALVLATKRAIGRSQKSWPGTWGGGRGCRLGHHTWERSPSPVHGRAALLWPPPTVCERVFLNQKRGDRGEQKDRARAEQEVGRIMRTLGHGRGGEP